MIRNNEYRGMLLAKLEVASTKRDNQIKSGFLHDSVNQNYRDLQKLLSEYDRLHPESMQVESVIVRDKRGYKDEPAHMKGCVTLFHNLSGCNITLIDNCLNIELK